mmetsp:Transcript_10342/g.25125  ORF Transcript_10342/g.25125 Transcript_10342/m.25125 type:complete len:146 (-) Transcript_10342:296-733(-)
MPYGTFAAEEVEHPAQQRSGSRLVLAAAALGACALVGAVALTSTPEVHRPVLAQKARQQSLAWGGFTVAMQGEADKALRLCDVGLLGKHKHCARHVVPVKYTKYTHSDEGQNEWAETQRELPEQSSITPHGRRGIGTPGDFGDRR